MSVRTGARVLRPGVARIFGGTRQPGVQAVHAVQTLVPAPSYQVEKRRSVFTMPVSDGGSLDFSPSAGEVNLSDAFFQPEVVIFDKDGTLVCFHTMWNSWCEELANRVRDVTSKDIEDNLYDLLGYDKKAKKVKLGMLAEKTHPYIQQKLVEMLLKEGFSSWEAKNVVEKTWKDTPENMQIKSTGNLRSLFTRLKQNKIKIAICTSDSREGTLEFLDRLNLSDLVDLVVCGDDPESKSKPNPHNARYICEKLNASLSEAIMVGDTPADTLMGQTANLGLTIGVLTGVGTEADLTHADLIVDDVTQVVDLITPAGETERGWHSVQVTARGLYKIAERSTLLLNQRKSQNI